MDTQKPLCRRLRDLLVEAETVLEHHRLGQQKRRREDVTTRGFVQIEAQTVMGARTRTRRRYQHAVQADNTMRVDAQLLQEALLIVMTQHQCGRLGVRTGLGPWRIRDVGLELGLLERSKTHPGDCLYRPDGCTPILPKVEGTRRVPAQLVIDTVKRIGHRQKWWMPKKAQGAEIRILGIGGTPGNFHLTHNGYLRPGTYAGEHKSELYGFAPGDCMTISASQNKTVKHHVVLGDDTTVTKVPVTANYNQYAAKWSPVTTACHQRYNATLNQIQGTSQLTRDAVEKSLQLELNGRNNPDAMLADMIRSGRAQGPTGRYGVLTHETADRKVVTILDTRDANRYRVLVRNATQPMWLQVLDVRWNDKHQAYWLQFQNHKGHRKGFFVRDTEQLLFRSPAAPFGSFCFQRQNGKWQHESFAAARQGAS